MRSRSRFLVRAVMAVALAATALVFAAPAQARTIPRTLADRAPVHAGPVEPGFPIDYVGVIWDQDGRGHDEHPRAVGSHGAVRFRVDGVWGPWTPLIPDGAQAEGQWTSGLVRGGDADAYQIRGIPAEAASPRAVALNTTDGPAVKLGERRGGTAGALESTRCRSRADWAADESLMKWQPELHPVQALTVHHTATGNADPDPASTVRAIYRYHAVDNGWGDIGYQYLVDEQGVVYEGRSSGTASRSCVTRGSDGTLGDGSDFGHEETDLDGDGRTGEMVTGAHASGWNSGNLGVALLGDFTEGSTSGGEPTAAALDGLEDVLAELSSRHGLDPTGTIGYVNPVNGSTKSVATISGHRDWNATECPGDRLYAQLPAIRQNVKVKLGSGGDDGTTPDPGPTLAVTGTTPSTIGVGRNQALQVNGSGFADGATVVFENGKGPAPKITRTSVDAGTPKIDLTVTVDKKGPSSVWDVRVTNRDGATAVCRGCLTIKR
jgi:hypothetical protein